jgi:hypothetical protein
MVVLLELFQYLMPALMQDLIHNLLPDLNPCLHSDLIFHLHAELNQVLYSHPLPDLIVNVHD